MKLTCPGCSNNFVIVPDESGEEVTCPKCHQTISLVGLLSLSDQFTLDETQIFEDPLLGPGDSLAHFKLTKVLGEGGFGTVYQAYDTRLDRDVALKVPKNAVLSERQANIFIREARAAAQLKDPNIVSVFEVGRDRDHVFIVSELIEGQSLSTWRKSHRPSFKQAADVVAKLAQSLHKAHEAGVIHRDVKPGNVLIDEHGEPQITDFGLAKRDSPDENTITIKGAMIGTPAYMSPEQASGHAEMADRRTDVYALGIILYELLTDRRPFSGNSDVIFNEIRQGSFEPPTTLRRSVPLDAEAICMKAMATKPGDRYQTALEFAADLNRFINDEPTLVRPLNKLERSALWFRRNRLLATVVPTLSLIAVILGMNLADKDPAPPPAVISQEPVIEPMEVEFVVDPPASEVFIIPIDPRQGEPNFAAPLSPRSRNVADADAGVQQRWSVSMMPGLYLIEVVTANGVLEVYRNVPFSFDEKKLKGYKVWNWSAIDEDQRRIDLEPIQVPEFRPTNDRGVIEINGERLCFVSSGTFRGGNNSFKRMTKAGIRARYPEREVEMPDYYLGESEALAANYLRVMGNLPFDMEATIGNPLPDQQVVTHVDWTDAIQYCELVGVRLPTFDEFLFAATNKGQTRYPYGDEFMAPETTIGTARQPAHDRTRIQPPIYNLYSSVAEWGWQIRISTDPTDDGKGVGNIKITPLMRDSRNVFGFLRRNVEQPDPRDFIDNKVDSTKPYNGFRVARSMTSRLRPLIAENMTDEQPTANSTD